MKSTQTRNIRPDALLLSALLLFAVQPQLAQGQIVADDVICTGCVDTADIADGAVNPNKIAPGSINATTIANGSIGPNKLIPGSINAATIANGVIGPNKLVPGSINAATIANQSIGANKLVPGSINASVIATGAVNSAKLSNNAVTSGKIAAGAISAAKFAAELTAGGTQQVTVTCPGSIQSAIDSAAPGGTLEITVNGNCSSENIYIRRDRVTLLGGASGQITGVVPAPGPAASFESVINVDGARGIRIENLTITGITGGNHGVLVNDNGSVTLDGVTVSGNDGWGMFLVESSNADLFNSTVENNGDDGVYVNQNSHFDSVGSTIQNNTNSGVIAVVGSTVTFDSTTIIGNPECGIFLSEASSGRLFDGNSITVNNPNFCGNNGCSTIGVYRNSSFRVTGANNTISNLAATTSNPDLCSAGGFALDAEMVSSLRIDGANTTIDGNVESFNLSTVDIRAGTVNGHIYSSGLATNVRLGGTSLQTTVNGTVYPSDTAIRLRTNGLLTVNGNVDCTNGNNINNNFTDFGMGFGYLPNC